MLARNLPWRTWSIAAIACVLSCLLYIALGSVNLPLSEIVSHLLSGPAHNGDANNLILWQIRLPRALACGFVGGILGLVGAVYQSVFRNPLAEPYVIGVSSGAAVGGTAAVILGLDFGLARIGLASLGSLLTLLLVVGLARRQGAVNIHTLLIGGVVTGAFLSGVLTLGLWLAGYDTGKILWWLLGSTSPMFWDRTVILGIALILGGAVLYRHSRALNAFAVDEFTAARQGVDVNRLKSVVLVGSSLLTGVAVGTVGIVGFIGQIGPHLARRMVGNDLRAALPLSAMLGSCLLIVADILAQRIHPPLELPLGAVTALVGAPFLLWMLRRKS